MAKSKKSNNRRLVIGILVALLALVLGILYFTPQPGATDEEKLRNLYLQESKADRESDAMLGVDVEVSEIKIDGNWALVSVVISREEWGGPIDGSVLVYQRFLGRWFSSYNYPWLRRKWIDQAPETLIAPGNKIYLR